MRDKFKSLKYFENFRISTLNSIEQGLEWIKDEKVKPSQLEWFKKGNLDYYLKLTISGYSIGADFRKVKEELVLSINYIGESWGSNVVRIKQNNELLNQYNLYAYDEMLWMLSLGYLLNISDKDFSKLVEVIDRDGVKDHLFEFIIRAKLPERENITEESYRQYFGVPKVFEKLRQAIFCEDKEIAEELVKVFITKDWYKNHKDAGWYNSHKSKHDVYFGYWSFETAAVVKILGLDDSNFKDCRYYPKDLVGFDS